MTKKRIGKKQVQAIALERIYRLFELAEQEFEKHPERSKRYVELARKIGTRSNVTIPSKLKKRFCKKCGAFLVYGTNGELEEKEKIGNLKCRECGAERKVKLCE